MHTIYDIPFESDGEQKHETLLISWQEGTDPMEVLHELGLNYAAGTEGLKKCGDAGLSFNEFLRLLTPEMLAPYDMQVMRLTQMATHVNADDMLISRYELKSHLKLLKYNNECAVKSREIAERYAHALTRLNANGHQLIGTWKNSRISGKAASWANQFVRSGEPDYIKFFNKKMDEYVSRAGLPPQNADDEQIAPQSADASDEQNLPQAG